MSCWILLLQHIISTDGRVIYVEIVILNRIIFLVNKHIYWKYKLNISGGVMETKIMRERLITFLLEAPMFMNLTPLELAEIIHIVKVEKYQAGDIVFKEGDSGDAWFVLYRGAVEVLKEDEYGDKKINELGPRACFGEMSVLDGLPRSATIRVTEDSEIFRIPRKDFAELLDDKHLIAYKLIQQMAILLSERQRITTVKLTELLRASEIIDIHEGIKSLVGESSTRE